MKSHVLWGLPTAAYQRVLDARADFFAARGTLKRALEVFEDAVREDDPFVRWELLSLHAHPLRRVHEHELSVMLPPDVENLNELASAGNPLAMIRKLNVDEDISQLPLHVNPVVLGAAFFGNVNPTCPIPLELLEFTARHYHVQAMKALIHVYLSQFSNILGQVSEAGWMVEALEWSGECVMPIVEPHLRSTYEYGRSRFFRYRTRSRNPALLCIRSDAACRRAVLCWL